MFGRGLRLGRVFGFELKADLSLIFLILLITVHLGAGVIPALHPAWSPWLGWGLAIVGALLVAVSIAVHELSHAVVGRRFGVEVRSITLFLFGGVSNIEREPESPKAELWMALVGPLTSLFLGAVLLLAGAAYLPPEVATAAAAESALASLGPGATLLLWLGSLNVVLGVFNLIPAFPLDGGRVFRAIVWQVTGSLEKATRWASTTGQAFGWLLVACGALMAAGVAVPIFGRGLIGGLWIAFIGWFLARAAAASREELRVRRALEGVAVSQLMQRDAFMVRSTANVVELVELFMRTDQPSLLVAEGGRLVGVVAVDDLAGVASEARAETPVHAIMTPRRDLTVLSPAAPAADGLREMVRRGIELLPVADADDHPRGVLRLRDVARWVRLHAAGGPPLRPVV